MKRIRLVLPFVMLLGFLSFVLMACSEEQSEEEAGSEAAEAEAPRVPVRTTTMEEKTVPLVSGYTATLEAWEQAHVMGQSGLRIEAIFVREGERVRRGQNIARMDDTSLRQAQVELRTARNEVERARRLVDIGAVARQQLEQAEAHFEVVESNVETLRSNTFLISPIDGVVTGKYFVAGEQFVPGAQAPSLVTVQQIDPLKAVINVSERYFSKVRPGMEARVRLDAYPGRDFIAQVERINPTISPESRTFRVEIRLDNGEGVLSPGMSGRVHLQLGELEGRFLPRAALQSQPGSADPFVFVIEDGQARRVFVQAGERVEQYQQVLSGIEADTQVVVEGMGRLNEGTLVRVLNQAPADESAEEGDDDGALNIVQDDELDTGQATEQEAL